MSSKFKAALFFLLIVLPGLLGSVTAISSFKNAESIQFCSSCHVMGPWYNDMTNHESESLVSAHFRHRWIQEEQCYTCHTDYAFLGPVKAKMKGMRHVIAYYIGDRDNIKLYEPFPNANCLHCHAEAATFKESPSHDALMEEILTGEESCIGCHDLVHDVPGYRPEDREKAEEEAKAAAEAAAGGEEKADDKAADEGSDAKPGEKAEDSGAAE